MRIAMTLAAASALILTLNALALAHGGAHETVMGTIHAAVETELVVLTTDDGPVPIGLRPSTRYVTTRGEKGTFEDLREGMRVIIKLNVQGKVADEVRYKAPADVEQRGQTGPAHRDEPRGQGAHEH